MVATAGGAELFDHDVFGVERHDLVGRVAGGRCDVLGAEDAVELVHRRSGDRDDEDGEDNHPMALRPAPDRNPLHR